MAVPRRKKKKGEEGSPDWLLTYGDMTTLLLTFFIFMFTMATIDGSEMRLILAAFQATDKADKSRLASQRKQLGFDPSVRSHSLTAASDCAKRSAKRVIAALCGDDAGKAEQGLNSTPLDTLRERGKRNGLSDYMSEVETRLLPLFE